MGQYYTVTYVILKKRANLEVGTYKSHLYAKSWLDAIDKVRTKNGSANVQYIEVECVTSMTGTDEIELVHWTKYSRNQATYDASYVEAS